MLVEARATDVEGAEGFPAVGLVGLPGPGVGALGPVAAPPRFIDMERPPVVAFMDMPFEPSDMDAPTSLAGALPIVMEGV